MLLSYEWTFIGLYYFDNLCGMRWWFDFLCAVWALISSHHAYKCTLLHSSSPHKLTLKAVSHAISAAVTSEKKTEDVKLRVR